MSEQQTSYTPESLLDIIRIIFKWRKKILLFVVACTILTAVSSFFMSNYYMSDAVFYPTNQEAYSRAGLFGEGESKSEIGDAVVVEQIMTFANSKDLIDFMIDKFHLYNHYNIDSTTAKGKDKARKRFKSLYKVIKNDFGAIELSIEDKDIELPQPMAIAALDKIDQLYLNALKTNRMKTVKAYSDMLVDRQKTMTGIVDTLRKLQNNYGIINVDGQGEALSTLAVQAEADLEQAKAVYEEVMKNPNMFRPDTVAILKSKLAGLERKVKALNSSSDGSKGGFNVKSFYEGGQLVKYYQEYQTNLTVELQNIQARYNEYKTSTILQNSAIILAEAPQAPLVKSRPKRSLIILGVSFISLILALLGALIADSYSRVDWKDVLK